jgi:S-ribosylhomocysteine lyase LuxS involved in autoinducer biosynthesis
MTRQTPDGVESAGVDHRAVVSSRLVQSIIGIDDDLTQSFKVRIQAPNDGRCGTLRDFGTRCCSCTKRGTR